MVYVCKRQHWRSSMSTLEGQLTRWQSFNKPAALFQSQMLIKLNSSWKRDTHSCIYCQRGFHFSLQLWFSVKTRHLPKITWQAAKATQRLLSPKTWCLAQSNSLLYKEISFHGLNFLVAQVWWMVRLLGFGISGNVARGKWAFLLFCVYVLQLKMQTVHKSKSIKPRQRLITAS